MGRFIFKYFNFIILLVIMALSLLPNVLLKFLFSILSSVPTSVGVGLRYVLLKSICQNIGDNVYIARWVVIKNPETLEIGNNVSIHEFSYIDALGGIKIGADTSIAHNCSLISFEHTWKDKENPIKYNELLTAPINIENNVWIGCGTRILSGSYISSRTIIAAGAVVKGSFDSNKILAGIPAKIIKDI